MIFFFQVENWPVSSQMIRITGLKGSREDSIGYDIDDDDDGPSLLKQHHQMYENREPYMDLKKYHLWKMDDALCF